MPGSSPSAVPSRKLPWTDPDGTCKYAFHGEGGNRHEPDRRHREPPLLSKQVADPDETFACQATPALPGQATSDEVRTPRRQQDARKRGAQSVPGAERCECEQRDQRPRKHDDTGRRVGGDDEQRRDTMGAQFMGPGHHVLRRREMRKRRERPCGGERPEEHDRRDPLNRARASCVMTRPVSAAVTNGGSRRPGPPRDNAAWPRKVPSRGLIAAASCCTILAAHTRHRPAGEAR
jgi:hypothetical protein